MTTYWGVRSNRENAAPGQWDGGDAPTENRGETVTYSDTTVPAYRDATVVTYRDPVTRRDTVVTVPRRSPARVPGRPAVPRGLLVGLVLQLGLLVGLTVGTGLHAAAWAAGSAVGIGTVVLLRRGLHRAGTDRLGPANRVTLARTVLIGGVAALAAESLGRSVPLPAVVGLTGVALLLDGVDGQVARRTGSVSALGARFDMEVDAFLILVLAVLMVRPVGPWVLAIGALRYGFIAAGRVLPWLTAPLPPRFSRKVVAAAQGVTLAVAVSGVLPPVLTVACLQAALAALCWSFGRDVYWLFRSARGR